MATDYPSLTAGPVGFDWKKASQTAATILNPAYRAPITSADAPVDFAAVQRGVEAARSPNPIGGLTNFSNYSNGASGPSAALTAAADHVAGAYGTPPPAGYKAPAAPVDDRQGDYSQFMPKFAASYPGGPQRQVGTTTLNNQVTDDPNIQKTVGADGKVSYSRGAATAGAGGVGASSAPSPIDTVRAHYNDLLNRSKTLSTGSTADKVMAAGLSKRAASLGGLLQGEAAAAHSMGQLHLQAQQQYPQIAATLAFLKAHENGDPNAYKILSGLHGNDPNAPMVAPFMAGVIRPSDVTPGGVTLGQGQGGTMGLQPLTPLPSLR